MSADGNAVDVCAFWVGEVVYGIDVARVDEILPRVVPLPVADSPSHVEGVVHVHGTAVPIVELRRVLPAGTPPRTAKHRGGYPARFADPRCPRCDDRRVPPPRFARFARKSTCGARGRPVN